MGKRPVRSAAPKVDTSDPPFSPPQWPAAQRETRLLKNLKPHPRNSHQHPPEQIAAIVAGIKKFGVYKVSVLVDETDTILAGHGFSMAAVEAGVEEIPVAVARGWTDEMKLAVLEADNRFPELAIYDNQLRADNLGMLRDVDFDMTAMGWSNPDALDDLLKWGTPLPDMPGLNSGDRQPFQQMTFTLHDDQVAIVRAAMERARKNADPNAAKVNENSNGNALAAICAAYVAA